MATILKLPAYFRDQGSDRFYALADQGFQGAGSLISTALLGRALPPSEFGVVGIAIGAYYFIAGFHRSAIALAYITEQAPQSGAAEERAYHSDWWWLSVVGSAALALALGAFLLPLLPVSLAWLREPLLLGASMTLPMLGAEFGRRWLYKLGRADLAALLSLTFFMTVITGAATVARLRPDAVAGIGVWFAAGTIATLVALLFGRPAPPRLRASLGRLHGHRGLALWLSLNIFPYTVYSTATVVVLIGTLLGPMAAAVFTAARTLTNPATSIVSAIDSVDKPRAARALSQDGVAGLYRSIRATRWLLMAATGAYLTLVAVAADPLLQLVFHGRYTGIGGEVRLLCLAFFLFCLNQPSETLLIVLRESRLLFLTRLGAALVTLIAVILAKQHGVSGMAWAIAASQIANIAFLYLAERHVSRRGNRAS